VNALIRIDWGSVFTPSLNIFEIFVRGTITYLFIFFLFRVFRRQAGAIGIPDLLLVVLIADAAQNAMSSEYKSITEGIILVGTIAFWDYSLDWLGYKFPKLRRIVRPSPLPLIKDGRIQRRNLRHEMITMEELMAELRQHGIESVEEVKESYLEGDGHISVIKKGSNDEVEVEKKNKPVG